MYAFFDFQSVKDMDDLIGFVLFGFLLLPLFGFLLLPERAGGFCNN